MDAEAFIEGAREFRAELEAISGKKGNGASPERMQRSMNMSVVPDTVNSASVMTHLSTRRLKRSVKRRM